MDFPHNEYVDTPPKSALLHAYISRIVHSVVSLREIVSTVCRVKIVKVMRSDRICLFSEHSPFRQCHIPKPRKFSGIRVFPGKRPTIGYSFPSISFKVSCRYINPPHSAMQHTPCRIASQTAVRIDTFVVPFRKKFRIPSIQHNSFQLWRQFGIMYW